MDSLTQFHDIFRFSRKKVVTLINVRQPEQTVESQFNENRFLFQPVKNLFAIIYLKCCFRAKKNKKLSYRRGTARYIMPIEILPIAKQQCRNYLYDQS